MVSGKITDWEVSIFISCNISFTQSHVIHDALRKFSPIYLFQVLDNSSEPLILCLNVGDHSPALLELILHLQNLAKVVGFLGCRLLEKSLLPRFPIFSHFAVNREGLSKSLQGKTEHSKNLLKPYNTVTNSSQQLHRQQEWDRSANPKL